MPARVIELLHLPPFARRRPSYWLWRRRLKKYRWPTVHECEQRQLLRIRKTVSHAYERTAGYRQLYDEARIHPRDLQTISDLGAFPYVTKELIRDNLEAFSVRRSHRTYITTGGSTGIPFGFYTTRRELAIEEAFIHDWWSRAGWRIGNMSAVLRGAFVGTSDQPAQFAANQRTLFLSSYYLDTKRAVSYLELLERHKITDLQAYPSSLAILLDALNGQAWEPPPALERVLLGSENIYEWLLEKARAAFPGVRFVGWYGQAERALFAWREQDGSYRVHPLYGNAELVNDGGAPCTVGEEGEIIGTAYHSWVTPFIRYRTMDRAVQLGHSANRWQTVAGRNHEVIVTGRGRLISMTAINMHDDLFDPLLQFQFVQRVPGAVEFHVVPRRPLASVDLARLRHGLAVKLGEDVELTIVQVTSIPRTPSGKLRFLDQRVPIVRHEQVS